VILVVAGGSAGLIRGGKEGARGRGGWWVVSRDEGEGMREGETGVGVSECSDVGQCGCRSPRFV
jgi:hypothetical protein